VNVRKNCIRNLSVHLRSYTPISDIIAGFKLVFNHPEKVIGEIFNIGSDKEITTKDGIAIVEKIMGKKARFDIKPKRPGDQLHTRANINKARRIFGYEPRTSLEEVLRSQCFESNRIAYFVK